MHKRIVRAALTLLLAGVILPLTATAATADGNGDLKLGPPRCCV